MRSAPVERTALILVGPALGADDFRQSERCNSDYVRRLERLSGASHLLVEQFDRAVTYFF